MRCDGDILLADEVHGVHAADIIPRRHGRTGFLIARQREACEVAWRVVGRAEFIVLGRAAVELVEGRRCLEARRPGGILGKIHIFDHAVLDGQPVER